MSLPETPAVGDIWYRAEVWGKIDGHVHYEKWYVTGVTPKGLWVSRSNRRLPEFDTEAEKKIAAQFECVTHHQAQDEWYTFSTRRISSTKEEALARLIARTAFWVKKERARLGMAEARYKMLTGAECPPEAPRLRTLGFFPNYNE